MELTVDILILGAGWTSQFLTPLCDERKITYAKTTRSGRDGTIKFEFDPDSDDYDPYKILPNARVVLITFPILKEGASERLVRSYVGTRTNGGKTKFIQLGTTTMWDGPRLQRITDYAAPQPAEHNFKWYTRESPYVSTPRAKAEEELLALSPEFPTTVLNLCGLWGGSRNPRNWVGKVAGTKEALKNKGSLHLIHGLDIARAILAITADDDSFTKAQGQRWLLSDGRIYDWWDLASAWGSPPASTGESDSSSSTANNSLDESPQAGWVRELMQEQNVRALPRNVELLGRALDSREFWRTFGINAVKTLVVP